MALAGCVFATLSCSTARDGGGRDTDALSVYVSILPQTYFVERIGKEHVTVDVLVLPGQSPATYEPSARQMAGLERADVMFTVGVPFERAVVPKIERMFPELDVVDTSRGITLRRMAAEHNHDHGHEEHVSDGRAGRDPHIWLSPRLVKIQAATIRDALKRLRPSQAAAFDRNYDAFAADLDRLDKTLAESMRPVAGKEMLVFHPSFGYFADAYGLRQVAIESEGKEPGPRELERIIARARGSGMRVIFVQKQFSTRSAAAIAEAIGGAVVPIDPLARDYIGNLTRLARAVKAGLSGGSVRE
jgi:zinc transport system substrate-binding protein